MVLVAPSILSADFSVLGEEIKRVEEAGADLLHLDVMDGSFVQNISFGLPVIESVCGKTKVPLDIHLMISEPEKLIERFLAFRPKFLSFHVEATGKHDELIELIKYHKVKAGIAVNALTPVKEVLPFLESAGMVLVMSVQAGFGGQKFIEDSIHKINELAELKKERGLDFEIEVDGGINEFNARKVAVAGATILVSGSTIFKSKNLAGTINQLRNPKFKGGIGTARF